LNLLLAGSCGEGYLQHHSAAIGRGVLTCRCVPPFAATRTYQVTGVVKAVTDTSVTVLTTKGKETWEIAKDDTTKVNGTLKEGAKVTIEYRMTATKVDVKEATAKK
jgi:hypothetical protein